MNIYSLLKLFTRIKSPGIKLAAILAAHKSHRRYIGVFLDPVMGCNLRCRMCYMSDPAQKVSPSKETTLNRETLDYVAETFFPMALKLQIGCATEPTLYPHLPEIISKAKEKGVPYISITTNGQLLTDKGLHTMIAAGLDEVTLSVHGFEKEVYEHLMPGGKFDRFKNVISILKEAKKNFPNFKVRINYIMNNDNIRSLGNIFEVLDGLRPDVVQLRPIQKLGESTYTDFSLDEIKKSYSDIIEPLRSRFIKEGTVILCPTLENLRNLEEDSEGTDEFALLLEKLTYYYITQTGVNKEDFQWRKDSFFSYHKRRRTAQNIFKSIWKRPRVGVEKQSTKKLNYKIK